jgi:hypothetical protein
MILNEAACDVLKLCTGHSSVAMIVDALAIRHTARLHQTIKNDVVAFLCRLESHGLIESDLR